ncbi:hypothetical protein JXR01_03590 [Candidatus Kaiserbacteria bacterium]|nr:MAG: hypothetical protein JXR01_03590 [Candidatus Kaiserbacteria bacterium]
MLSIEKCRELIEDDEKYSDEQIIEIRDALDQLASIFVDKYFSEKFPEENVALGSGGERA